MVSLENIEFITLGLRPLMITITTRDIFQYFLTAIKDSLNHLYDTYIKRKRRANVYITLHISMHDKHLRPT